MTSPHRARPHRAGPAAPAVRVTAPVAVPVEVSVADLIGAAVLACPMVVGLHSGRFGEAATYLPGRRVTGIRVTPTGVFVHLIGAYPATVTDIDAAVRAAVHPHLAGLPLTITIEDYATAATTTSTPPVITATEPATAPITPELGTAAAAPSATPPPTRVTTAARIADVTKEIL